MSSDRTLAERWRAVTLLSVAGLLTIVFSWQLWPLPSLNDAGRGLLLSLPLLLPVHGLWQGKRYTYKWATLCVIPYFVVGLTEVVASPDSRPWTATMLAVALLWFVGLIAFLRVTARDAR